MFYCGHVRLGFTQGPLHSSRHFLGRAGWWWRMGWPINQPVGIYGEIIAFLFPSPPSKTGWRAGGKKAASHMEGSYLDWALADFSGYIAADELYSGSHTDHIQNPTCLKKPLASFGERVCKA